MNNEPLPAVATGLSFSGFSYFQTQRYEPSCHGKSPDKLSPLPSLSPSAPLWECSLLSSGAARGSRSAPPAAVTPQHQPSLQRERGPRRTGITCGRCYSWGQGRGRREGPALRLEHQLNPDRFEIHRRAKPRPPRAALCVHLLKQETWAAF